MDKVLVTGGTGFIGYYLIKLLINQGYAIDVVDNLSRSSLDDDFRRVLPDVRFIQGDLTEPLDNLGLASSYRYIFHLAAINGVKYANLVPEKVLRSNILSTIRVLDWCAVNPPENLLFASSSEVYHGGMKYYPMPMPTPESILLAIEDPYNPRLSYAASKIFGELMTIHQGKRYGFNARVVRYHNIYGPRMGYDHVIPEIIKRIHERQSPFSIYGPHQTRSFCFIDDAARATMQFGFLSKGHHIANIGNSTEEIKIKDLYTLLFEMTDYHSEVEFHPAPEGSPDRRCPDTSFIEQLIGFQPEIPLRLGLQLTLDWYQKSWVS